MAATENPIFEVRRKLPKMRTAEGVLLFLRDLDPDTDITLHYIRQIIHTRQVPVTNVGRKKLVDAERVLEYIASGSPAPAEEYNGIRRVSSR